MNSDLPLTSSSSAIHPSSRWQPRFWTVWTGQAFSLVGSALTQFVLMWWITKTTGSVSALAMTGIFALLSTLMGLAGPLGLLLMGPLGELIGVRGVFIVGGSLSALICLLALRSKGLWALERESNTLTAKAKLEQMKPGGF